MKKGLIYSVLAVCVVLLACNAAFAAPPSPPWMGFYGTVTGMPGGCTAHIEIVNASGVVSGTSTTTGDWGSPSNPVKVFGSAGDTLTVRINGHQVATWSFDDPGAIVSKTLAYPATASPSPSPSPSASPNPSNGGTVSYGDGSIGGTSTSTPTPTSTVTPLPEPTITPTPTPTPTPMPPTATPLPPQGSSFSWWWILLLLAIIVIAGVSYYFYTRRS